MNEALADYDAVLRGRKPRYARPDKSQYRLTDGGTCSYVGRNYNLTVVQSLSRIGGVDGFIYGPIIKFAPSVAPGNEDTICHTVFYTTNAFNELISNQ